MAVVNGGANYNATVAFNFIENGFPVFYVRPYTEDLTADLRRLKREALEGRLSAYKGVKITEENGTYRFCYMSDEPVENLLCGSFWGMLFKRFLSESKNVCIDRVNDQRFYAVIMSHEFIQPCPRRIAV